MLFKDRSNLKFYPDETTDFELVFPKEKLVSRSLNS